MRRTTVDQDAERDRDNQAEAFYERMMLTREIEALIEALYRDFLALRLSDTWDALVVPALRAWSRGKAVDADKYRAARTRAIPTKRR
jgi:transposase-like protein